MTRMRAFAFFVPHYLHATDRRGGGCEQLKKFVIPDPTVTYRKLTANDQYLIIASDGLWDFMGPNTAAVLVSFFSPLLFLPTPVDAT